MIHYISNRFGAAPLTSSKLWRKIEAAAKEREKQRAAELVRARRHDVPFRRSRHRELLSIRRWWAQVALVPQHKILAEVAEKHGVALVDLLERDKRTRKFCIPRFEAAYRLRMERGLSFPQIGKLLGGRDHTTALHAVRRHAAFLEAGP